VIGKALLGRVSRRVFVLVFEATLAAIALYLIVGRP